jgi:hypothetical protein
LKTDKFGNSLAVSLIEPAGNIVSGLLAIGAPGKNSNAGLFFGKQLSIFEQFLIFSSNNLLC